MGRIFIIVAIALAGASAPSHAALQWHRYTNVRYGYSICYPAFFTAHPEPDAGDGRTFTGKDGSELVVFGSYDSLRHGVAGEAQEEADLSRPGDRITYRRNGRGWSVISGVHGSDAIYLKTLGRDDRLVTFRLAYPLSKSAAYRPIVTAIEHCFQIGTAPF